MFSISLIEILENILERNDVSFHDVICNFQRKKKKEKEKRDRELRREA